MAKQGLSVLHNYRRESLGFDLYIMFSFRLKLLMRMKVALSWFHSKKTTRKIIASYPGGMAIKLPRTQAFPCSFFSQPWKNVRFSTAAKNAVRGGLGTRLASKIYFVLATLNDSECDVNSCVPGAMQLS